MDCITTRTGKSRLQVILRWMFQLGIVSIPRSGNPLHMRENRDLFDFELNGEEMELMECLNENHPLHHWVSKDGECTLPFKNANFARQGGYGELYVSNHQLLMT